MSMETNTQIDQLVNLIRWINSQGWSPATSTNYSLRHPSDNALMYISKSGVDKQFFNTDDLMICDLAGKPNKEFSGIKSSAETLIHCWIYQKDPKVNCILHSHSVYSTVLSRNMRSGDLCINGLEVQKALPGIESHLQEVIIPCFDNSQDMTAFTALLEKTFPKSLPSAASFLMAGHGLYTWGKDLSEAKKHLEAIEFLLECNYKLNLIRK